jgi:ABC-2 type transport system permease protein
MELMVWGFTVLYLKTQLNPDAANIIIFLISGMIFWDILYRSQQGVSISMVEDIWTRNVLNLIISPLKVYEWIIATCIYGMIKTLVITFILSLLALIFYQFNIIDHLGFYLIPLMFNLLIFGWALGIFTSGLLIRWGNAVQALIWGIPFLFQPLSAIYYPLSVLPPWLQKISLSFPSTYVFEAMRYIIEYQEMPWNYFWISLGLNILYLFIFSFCFYIFFNSAKEKGKLARLGSD